MSGVGNIAKLLHGPPPSKEQTKDKIQSESSSCTGIWLATFWSIAIQFYTINDTKIILPKSKGIAYNNYKILSLQLERTQGS
jgi:hypothetical protein